MSFFSADDLVFFSSSVNDIQIALDNLSSYCQRNKIEVNMNKTKVMKFRRGGPFNEVFVFDDAPVEHANMYEYLGITLQSSWTFTSHIRKKRAKALAASFAIKGLRDLSIDGAKKFFSVMVEPIITYGIEAFWEDLSVKHLELIDCCMFDFYKKVLGIHRSTRNRLVLLMLNLPLLTESLVRKGRVPTTPNFNSYLGHVHQKMTDVECDFFLSPAMTQENWRRAKQENRHLICRSSVHGFHHKFCCQNRSSTCICNFCDESASSLGHIFECCILKHMSLLEIDQLE